MSRRLATLRRSNAYWQLLTAIAGAKHTRYPSLGTHAETSVCEAVQACIVQLHMLWSLQQ